MSTAFAHRSGGGRGCGGGRRVLHLGRPAIRECRARERKMPSYRPGRTPSSRRTALQARAEKAEAENIEVCHGIRPRA